MSAPSLSGPSGTAPFGTRPADPARGDALACSFDAQITAGNSLIAVVRVPREKKTKVDSVCMTDSAGNVFTRASIKRRKRRYDVCFVATNVVAGPGRFVATVDGRLLAVGVGEPEP